MRAKLEEAILGSIGARQEMVRRSRGQLGKLFPLTEDPEIDSYPQEQFHGSVCCGVYFNK